MRVAIGQTGYDHLARAIDLPGGACPVADQLCRGSHRDNAFPGDGDGASFDYTVVLVERDHSRAFEQ